MDRRDVKAILTAIHELENMNFSSRLAEELAAAKKLLKSLERIEALKEAVLKMDQKTMLELKNYSKPPKMVHQVMRASLLLLGYDETSTVVSRRVYDWSSLDNLILRMLNPKTVE